MKFNLIYSVIVLTILIGCKTESETDVSKEPTNTKEQQRTITISDILKIPSNFQSKYKVVNEKNFSFRDINRRQIRINIPLGLMREDIILNIYHSIKMTYNKYKPDGISVFVHKQTEGVNPGDLIATADFAPYGDWDKIKSGVPLNQFDVSIDFKEGYFEPQEKKTEKPELPSYVILDQDVYDAPIKTQVVQHILVSGSIDKIYLRNLLASQYVIIMKKDDFKYHKNPTHAFVYLYNQEDNAKSQSGQWIAMLQKTPYDQEYIITIRENLIRIRDEQKQPVKRFNLDERERRQILKEYIATESKSLYDALSKEPDNFKKQIKLGDKLMEEYKNQLAKKYNLTRNQLEEIVKEGYEKNWSIY